MEKELEGLNIVVFEARHAKTMSDLVRLRGGNPISAPAMKEVPLKDNPKAFSFAERLFKNEIDVLILLTGVGTRALVAVLETRYPKDTILEALKQTTIVPRGPKPIRALNEMGVPYALAVPEPNTWKEILKTLDENAAKVPVANRCVAVQEYGVRNPELLRGLEERGAQVFAVPVYAWALPDDLEPIKRAIETIICGQAHAVLFTTAVQVDHVLKVAADLKKEDALRKSLQKILVASIGPDCSENLRNHNLVVHLEAIESKMAPFVARVAQHAQRILKSLPA